MGKKTHHIIIKTTASACIYNDDYENPRIPPPPQSPPPWNCLEKKKHRLSLLRVQRFRRRSADLSLCSLCIYDLHAACFVNGLRYYNTIIKVYRYVAYYIVRYILYYTHARSGGGGVIVVAVVVVVVVAGRKETIEQNQPGSVSRARPVSPRRRASSETYLGPHVLRCSIT